MPGYFRPSAAAALAPSRPSTYVATDAHATMLVAESAADAGARRGAAAAAPALVGALLARIYDTPDDPSLVMRRRAHVEALVVDERHRRSGIGTALMNAATDWARARGAVEIVLTVWAGNAAAEAFYGRLGYRIISRALGKPIG